MPDHLIAAWQDGLIPALLVVALLLCLGFSVGVAAARQTGAGKP